MKAVDLFAGWGGFTTGAQRAGVRVVWAGNHWRVAVDVHALNHPGVTHACQDLRQADWTALPSYELLLASPACQGHSRASQPVRRPRHDADRATAWAVIDCAEATSPRAIVVENVPNFLRWPLYAVWRQALTTLGYYVTEQVIDATSCGVPQRRKRVVVTATKKPRPLRLEPSSWTEPPFEPCVDWTAPGMRPIATASADAQERMAAGRRKLGRRFLSQHTTGHSGIPLHESIRTITTQDQWLLVDWPNYRPLSMREYARGQSFPDSYTWPADLSRDDTLRGIGNAIPVLLAEHVVAALA